MKAKLTISIDKRLVEETRKEADRKHMPVSGVVENFLEFFVRPYVYCFRCGERFYSNGAKNCPKCGWIVCSKCKACRCSLSEEGAVVAYHMRKVYEQLLGGRVE